MTDSAHRLPRHGLGRRDNPSSQNRQTARYIRLRRLQNNNHTSFARAERHSATFILYQAVPITFGTLARLFFLSCLRTPVPAVATLDMRLSDSFHLGTSSSRSGRSIFGGGRCLLGGSLATACSTRPRRPRFARQIVWDKRNGVTSR